MGDVLLCLLTYFTEPFATFVIIASLEHSTGRAVLLSLTNGYFVRGALLVVPKVFLTFDEGD